jgi:hypothetical protein
VRVEEGFMTLRRLPLPILNTGFLPRWKRASAI